MRQCIAVFLVRCPGAHHALQRGLQATRIGDDCAIATPGCQG